MKRVVAAVIALAFCGVVRAQTLPDRIDTFAHAALSRPVVGISVAVARDGQVVFARGYGMANLAMIKDKPFDFEPGTAWRYDNSAFYIAGMVIERVTRQEYGAYVRERLFQPLGMTSARLCDARMIVPHLASGYERDNGTFFNAPLMTWKLPWAAGAVCSTATDLAKWETALDGGRVLRASSLALMRTPTTLADGTIIDYGLGTRLGSLDGHRAVGHTGNGGGYANALESFPDDHLTVVVLMNTEVGSGAALKLAGAIARATLGLPEKKVRDLGVPARELAAVSGIYESDDGRIETFGRDGKLYFRQLPAGAEAPLRREGEDLYAVDENTEVRFYERDGRAQWVVAYTGGLMTGASRHVK